MNRTPIGLVGLIFTDYKPFFQEHKKIRIISLISPNQCFMILS